jgi:hypothetical protein
MNRMSRVILTIVLLAACGPAGAAVEDVYSKQPTWAASMAATRRNMLAATLKDITVSPWRMSDPMPAESLADEPVPGDKVDAKTRDAKDQRVLRHDPRWEDAAAHGLDGQIKTVRYLYRQIAAGAAEDVEVRLGCDSAAAVWLNGEKVQIIAATGKCMPGQYSFQAKLRKGPNDLLVKVFIESGRGRFQFEIPAARQDRAVIMEGLYRRFWEDFAETDWYLQDNPLRRGGEENFDVARDFGWYFTAPRDTSLEQRMIARVLGQLGPASAGAGASLAGRLEAMVKSAAAADDPAWLEMYVAACRVRRTARLARLAELAPRIIFTKHYTMGGSHYAYTEGQSDAQAERTFNPPSALCLLTCDGNSVRTETLLDDPKGVIRDPDVTFDGRRAIFAWKKSDRQDDYHLYEMDLATRKIRQLTAGLGVADYEATCLAGGDIVFNSTRCVQIVDCWWTEVSNLYRCDADGQFLRRLTFDQVHDNFPTVTEDGRVLYTRWEYNDRGQVYPQPLDVMNADGTGQTECYGGNSWFPTTILHARAIAGTQKIVAIATGHHSRQTGKLIIVDPARGRQENEGVQLIAPRRNTPADKIDAYGQNGELFQYPYPLSETEFLVAYHPVGWRWPSGGWGPRFGVYFMTIDGGRELLASDPRLPCGQPIPVRARAGRARPTYVDYRQTEGTCYIQDVYAGPGLAGVPRGAARTLRVVTLDFRAAGIGSNGNGGPGGGAMISTPPSVGNGAWDPKTILGDVTIHQDGSAFFRVPARTPVYFQILDAKGRMIQTMRSWVTLQPGENAACVGCHENKNTTPLAYAQATVALRGAAEDLRPFYGKPRGFSFPHEVQPILDRHCTRCHDGKEDKDAKDGKDNKDPKVAKRPDLRSTEVLDREAKRRWSQSYLSLTHARADSKDGSRWLGSAGHPVVNWVSAQSAPPMQPPMSAGSGKSKLLAMLDAEHHEVKLTREEFDKLAAWIDLGVPFCGDYVEANAWSDGEMKKYEHYLAKRQVLAAEERAAVEAWSARQP